MKGLVPADDVLDGGGLDRSDPFRGDPAWSAIPHALTGEAPRELSDEDLPRGGRLLQPRGDDHRTAGHERRRALVVPGHDLAAVDADAQLDRRCWRKVRDDATERHRRTHGALGVVIVRERDPEHRHDRVADELLDGAAVRDQDLPHAREDAGQRSAHDLGVVRGRDFARLDDVGEEDRGELALLRHDGSLGVRFPARTADAV